MPLISAAKLSGIMSRPGPMPVLCEMRSATGMKIAVTAVELIVAPSPQTTSIRRPMKPDFVLAGLGDQPVAEHLRDTGSHQAVADDKERRDEHDVGVAEAGQRLPHGQHAGEGQRHQHNERDRVQPRPADREHDDRGGEQHQNNGEICVHLRPLSNGRRFESGRRARPSFQHRARRSSCLDSACGPHKADATGENYLMARIPQNGHRISASLAATRSRSMALNHQDAALIRRPPRVSTRTGPCPTVATNIWRPAGP